MKQNNNIIEKRKIGGHNKTYDLVEIDNEKKLATTIGDEISREEARRNVEAAKTDIEEEDIKVAEYEIVDDMLVVDYFEKSETVEDVKRYNEDIEIDDEKVKKCIEYHRQINNTTDATPENILYNKENEEYILIDFDSVEDYSMSSFTDFQNFFEIYDFEFEDIEK